MKTLVRLLSVAVLFATATCLCHAQVVNNCLRLAPGGSVDCGPMPELDGLKSFTIQFWFNADEWTEGATLFSRGEELSVRLGETNTLMVTARGREIAVKRTSLTTGKWIPVMILSQDARIQVFVEKVAARNMTASEAIPETGNPFFFGGDNYKGRIDEVRIWDTELSSDYEYFTNTTLNKWAPQLSNLVAYFKFDQPWCANVVDYKPLFVPTQKTNHHGILSATGATREKVTDNNDGLPYLLMGGYTDNKRFFDNAIERDKYLLSNDLIILGLQSYSDGHVRPLTANDHGTVRNGEYLDYYKNKRRAGVLSLKGQGSYVICPSSVFTPSTGYTLETWICIEEWTEGAFIFKKENAAATQGFSVRLGTAADRQLIVRIDGREYFFKNTLQTGQWSHLAITPGTGGSNRYTVFCLISGRTCTADGTLSDPSTDPIPTGMDGLRFYIGQNMNAKFDETIIWNKTCSTDDITLHRNGTVPMPGPGKPVTQQQMWDAHVYYRYDIPDNLGFDSYSQDGWAKIMTDCYEGYTGFQVRISVQGHTNWQSTIADANKRKLFAADVAELSKPYAGVELDLEWMDGTQTNLGLLADEILAVLPKGKTLMISHHQYGAYQFPKEKIQNVHGFTFQQYGPQSKWYGYNMFVQGYNAFINYGYPKEKIYLSYGTTTSNGFTDSGSYAREPIGYSWGLIGSDYTPATDGSVESGKWNGNTFYFCGPVQVYNRAKFVRDNQVMGLFYWDICNDLSPSNVHSLNRNANYALNANVDPRADEVVVNHPVPTPVRTVTIDESGYAGDPSAIYDMQGRRVQTPGSGIYIVGGKKVMFK
ncbi:MAG: hypothetical protein IJS89_07110 [Bacteroidaceae bacterium]|nr:hypothetical protein [Bacteroidaceae bacterium]